SPISSAVLPELTNILDPDGHIVIVQVIESVGEVLAATIPPAPMMSATLDQRAAEEIMDGNRAEASGHLDAARAMLAAQGFHAIAPVIAEGTPGDAIIELAQSRGSDVVVMSTHGRGGLERAVVGSVADHVVRHLDDIPVLLLHPHDEQMAS